MKHFRNLSNYLEIRNNKFTNQKREILIKYFELFSVNIKNVIEIGPGPGVWSDELLLLCSKFGYRYILIEPDVQCYHLLNQKYHALPNVSVLNVSLEFFIENISCTKDNAFFVFDAFNYLNINSISYIHKSNQPLIVYQVHTVFYYLYYFFSNVLHLKLRLSLSRIKSLSIYFQGKFVNNFDKPYSKKKLKKFFPNIVFISNSIICKSFFPSDNFIFAFIINI